MRIILIMIAIILAIYYLNKKVPASYILIKTILSSLVAILTIILTVIILLHLSGSSI